MTNTEKWQVLRRVLLTTVPIGSLIGVGIGWLLGGPSAQSLASGALIGFMVTAGIVAFDVSWVVGLIPRGWTEAPFLVVLVTRSLVYLAVLLIGIGVPLLTVGGRPPDEFADASFATTVVISFVAALLFNFVGQVNRLLGRGVLISLILGRYHRPREEERVFLLVDLQDSTKIAEQLGNLRYHAFLKRFISDVSAAAIRHNGEVHRYVGDEVIITWLARDGLRDARCVATVFGISDAIDQAAPEYMDEFGVVPRFWAGLHLGEVVTGEIGTVKHEIAFLGDTLNTSARIEAATKELHHQFLASGQIISSVELPDGVNIDNLGSIELKGVKEPVEIFAVTRLVDRAADT